jgi:threonine/homoserine/homoserine lactone efflux protein
MDDHVMLKAFFVGFFTCAPIGPIGLWCVRQTLNNGRLAGLMAVLGATTVDGIYCTLAGFGITFISEFVQSRVMWLECIGGLILIGLGVAIYLSEPVQQRGNGTVTGLAAAFTSSFLLMLANPMPILVFAATFAALGVHGWNGDYLATSKLVAGVLLGSALWAPILVVAASIFHARVCRDRTRLINKVAGATILGVGGLLTFRVFFSFAK